MNEVTRFKVYLHQSDRKPLTIYKLCTSIKFLLRRTNNNLNRDSVDNLFVQMKEEGKSARYINTLIGALRAYAKFAGLEDLYDLKEYKELRALKSTMSDDEIEAFLSLPCPKTRIVHPKTGKVFERINSKAGYDVWTQFFSIMAYTGMRTGEVAKLTVDDIDFGRQIFTLKDTKTNDNRLVPIPPNITASLREYVKEKDHYLFPSANGGRHLGGPPIVDNVDWHYNFHTRIRAMGIKRKGLTPYSLRHSFITRMLEEDVNIFKVQKIVGHRRLETTANYTHLTTKDIQTAIRKLPLIRKATNPREKLKSIIEALQTFCLADDPGLEYTFNQSHDGFYLSVRVKESL